jgi:hypothetical protein
MKFKHGQPVLRLCLPHQHDEAWVEEGRVYLSRYAEAVLDAGGPKVPVEFRGETPLMARDEIVLDTPANLAAMTAIAHGLNEAIKALRQSERERTASKVRALARKRLPKP